MSMNIGDIAVALTQKDAERLTIRAELNKLEDFQASGTEYLVRITSTRVEKEGLDASKVVYSYSIDHTNFKYNGKMQGEVVDFQALTDKDVVDIIAEVSTSTGVFTYLAQFSTAKLTPTAHSDNVAQILEGASSSDEAPAVNSDEAAAATAAVVEEVNSTSAVTSNFQDWMTFVLDAVDGDDADSLAKVVITAKRITLAAAIAEKSALLEEKAVEIAEIQKQLREAQAATAKKSAASPKKKTTTSSTGKKKSTGSKTTKKTGKNTASKATDDDDDEADETSNVVVNKSYFKFPSIGELQGLIINGGFLALNTAINNRAFVFFGAAAVASFLYGDYASV